MEFCYSLNHFSACNKHVTENFCLKNPIIKVEQSYFQVFLIQKKFAAKPIGNKAVVMLFLSFMCQKILTDCAHIANLKYVVV